jgi:ATP-binding cassette subfamily B protein
MVCRFYGRPLSLQFIKGQTSLTRQGMSLESLSRKATSLGFKTLEVLTSFEKLAANAPLPAIAHWKGDHFVVVYKITAQYVYLADPAKGRLKLTKAAFLKGWSVQPDERDAGILLLLEPTPDFFHADSTKNTSSGIVLPFIATYLKRYRRNVFQIIIGLLLGSVIQIIIPFLTQAIVDRGIHYGDVSFIYAVLIIQLVLYVSATSIEFMRTWVFIHLSTRINVFIISDFLGKLMRLPVSFFDSRIIGDLTQRINDHKRIEQFITDTLVKSLFSIFTLTVFAAILFYFSVPVFAIFMTGTVIQLSWIFFFLKKLRLLDYESFALMAKDNSKILEIITGMQEIKLNNIEQDKREEWQGIQSSLFNVNLTKLRTNQVEQGGTRFIGYLQIILIMCLSAISVLQHQMTLGTMMSILFIVGQLNGPVSQLINFILSTQMARISMGRLAEVHNHPEEEEEGATKIETLPADHYIEMTDVRFAYAEGQEVLKGIQLHIPKGKITAIVGLSGSGKTTLIRLLLKYYTQFEGDIRVGDTPLADIRNAYWRDHCGAVLQDSFIFSDSIGYNISLQREPDPERLLRAAKAANIREFIESLPLKYGTRIGQDGFGISHGQKQRILIARAIYKDPEFIFFDEATNSLDARNEYIIMQNLQQFFKGRTVVIVAHRLSTVRNADQIVVLDQGLIVEAGTHQELMAAGGNYYALVQNQVELGAKDILNTVEI